MHYIDPSTLGKAGRNESFNVYFTITAWIAAQSLQERCHLTQLLLYCFHSRTNGATLIWLLLFPGIRGRQHKTKIKSAPAIFIENRSCVFIISAIHGGCRKKPAGGTEAYNQPDLYDGLARPERLWRAVLSNSPLPVPLILVCQFHNIYGAFRFGPAALRSAIQNCFRQFCRTLPF